MSILASLSLLLCIAAITLWVRSCWVADEFTSMTIQPERYRIMTIGFDRDVRRVQVRHVGSVSGRVFFGESYVIDRQNAHWERQWSYMTRSNQRIFPIYPAPSIADTRWDYFGFGRLHDERVSGNVTIGNPSPKLAESDDYYWFPYWPFCLLTSLLPAFSLARAGLSQRRRWRVLRGCCPICGYDLRATPDRCPECGIRMTGKSTTPNATGRI